MRYALLAFYLGVFAAAGHAHAQSVTIGLAAPVEETFAILGEQFAEGARAAIRENDGVELVESNSACTEEGGRQAAEALLEANVQFVIGFLCTPAVEAALPLLAEAGIPVITPVRTDSLTDGKERTGWPVFRLGPRADGERDAVADILVSRWRDVFFAIVDDGTIYGRELAEHFRAAAERAELKPVLFDTFRPQLDNQIGLLGRLRRAGATHVFVGGDRADIAIMARDAEQLDYDVVLAGGEALRASDGEVPLSQGVLMIGPPRWEDLAQEDVLSALETADTVPEGYVIPGYTALQVAAAAARIAQQDGLPIEEVFQTTTFETAIGPVDFDGKGDLSRELYRLFRYDGEEFVEVE
ncbi:branched-chain amino acid ABC transporter substrate-binding protein [Chelativorans sp. YIM 93263]|uniref:branched-chain amino acid ABC transporter substrate-binding protein n=1 Tax=Chelativorans sp. YIM 93263 TaxID=2906648 RepID=UPI00237901FD|nr:branched-chain amino acid ABC transporter substrate-binding protein [Chelativorans sp. YIM 93263]